MPQINDIRELAQQNAGYVSNSPQDWMSYLDVAARLYRYSFTDTLLIHAQRPDATACAELELWNQKMSRWVNRGAKGIALLDDTGPRTKLRYVFDIADTHLVRGGKTPLLWNLDSHEHEQTILDHLADTYGLSQTDSMNTALMENYNMIDGCVNNVPKKPRRIGGRWSVLDRLHIKQAERRQKDNAPQQEQERSRKS